MKKKFFLITLLVLLTFTLTGCFSKQAKTPDEVKDILLDSGFTLADSYNSDGNQGYNFSYPSDSRTMIIFVKAKDTDTIDKIYDEQHAKLEQTRDNCTNYSSSSGSGTNYDRLMISCKGEYGLVAKVDNTLLMAAYTESSRPAIKEALQKIGY